MARVDRAVPRAALVVAAAFALGACEIVARFDASRLDAGRDGYLPGVDAFPADARLAPDAGADASPDVSMDALLDASVNDLGTQDATPSADGSDR